MARNWPWDQNCTTNTKRDKTSKLLVRANIQLLSKLWVRHLFMESAHLKGWTLLRQTRHQAFKLMQEITIQEYPKLKLHHLTIGLARSSDLCSMKRRWLRVQDLETTIWIMEPLESVAQSWVKSLRMHHNRTHQAQAPTALTIHQSKTRCHVSLWELSSTLSYRSWKYPGLAPTPTRLRILRRLLPASALVRASVKTWLILRSRALQGLVITNCRAISQMLPTFPCQGKAMNKSSSEQVGAA